MKNIKAITAMICGVILAVLYGKDILKHVKADISLSIK